MSRHFSLRGPAASVALAFVAGYGHLIYPLYLATRSRARVPAPDEPADDEWPPISVVVPAYLEASVIGHKVEDLRTNGYPGTVEVVVAADDPETAAAARAASATVVESEHRRGKAAALNHAVAATSHDIVFFNDANTSLSNGALQAMTRWFGDPSVAAVAGEKQVRGDEGESAYWRFESWLKRREVETSGTTIGLVGELAAIRKSVFRALPEGVTNDDLWIALDVTSRNLRIAYEPSAVALEDAGDLEDDWERRTRVVAGGLDVLWRRREELAPGGSPVAAQIWGHRLVRTTAGPIAHAALLNRSIRSFHRSRAARAFLAANAFAGYALWRRRRGEDGGTIERAAAQVAWLQLVAFGGMRRWATGESTSVWPKRERAAAPGAAAR